MHDARYMPGESHPVNRLTTANSDSTHLDSTRSTGLDWNIDYSIYLTKPCGAGLHTRSENFDARLGAGIENDGFQRAGQRFGVPKESILFTCLPFSENTCYLFFWIGAVINLLDDNKSPEWDSWPVGVGRLHTGYMVNSIMNWLPYIFSLRLLITRALVHYTL